MGNWYLHRDTFKVSLGLDASATGSHALVDSVLEGVAREVDRYVGFGFYPALVARYYTPARSQELSLDYPLTSISAIALDTDGNASYNSTMSATDYYLGPYNASAESPPRPYWEIELAVNSTAAFPSGTQRGARVTGTWGYYDQHAAINVALSTAMGATATSAEFTNSSNLHPGQTILIGTEQAFVTRNGKSGSDTATTSGTVGLERGVNGTVAATHASGLAVEAYSYPVVDRAVMFQAAMDYRAAGAPLGFTGGDAFGGQQSLNSGAGGLHPFTRRTLEQFRRPMAH